MIYYAILCYAMLYYAMLCNAMLCYTILYYTIFCYAMLCYDVICYATLYYAMLCYAILILILILYYTIMKALLSKIQQQIYLVLSNFNHYRVSYSTTGNNKLNFMHLKFVNSEVVDSTSGLFSMYALLKYT